MPSKNEPCTKLYRWAFLDDDLPDDTVQNIGETVQSSTLNNGLFAILDEQGKEIVRVYGTLREVPKNILE